MYSVCIFQLISFIQCTDWSDNKEIFCSGGKKSKKGESDEGSDDKSANLEFLCTNPKITSGGSGPNGIYLFRGGKYWLFDNKPKPDMPFGNLEDGPKPAKEKWKEIHFPAGVCVIDDHMIIVYKNEWSKYPSKPSDKDSNQIEGKTSPILNQTDPGIESLDLPRNEPIRDPELPDDSLNNDKDGGALINPDKGDPTYRKIKGNRVCRYVINKEDKCLLRCKCITVEDDKNKFPPNIVAAIKSSENMWYFVNKEGKHCQRKDGSTEEVIPLSYK